MNTRQAAILSKRPAASVPTSSDADVTAWITGVYAAGSTVSQAAADAVTVFVVGLKADTVWGQILDMGLFLGPTTLAGALVKLKDTNPVPIVNVNFVSSDYSATLGITGATGKRLTVAKTPTALGWQQNSASLGIYMTQPINGIGQQFLGNTSSVVRNRFLCDASFVVQAQINNVNIITSTMSAQPNTGTGRGMLLATLDTYLNSPGEGLFIRGYGNTSSYIEQVFISSPRSSPSAFGSPFGILASNSGSNMTSPVGGYFYGLSLNSARRIAMTSRWDALIDTLVAL
jgi:hypothetical protein